MLRRRARRRLPAPATAAGRPPCRGTRARIGTNCGAEKEREPLPGGGGAAGGDGAAPLLRGTAPHPAAPRDRPPPRCSAGPPPAPPRDRAGPPSPPCSGQRPPRRLRAPPRRRDRAVPRIPPAQRAGTPACGDPAVPGSRPLPRGSPSRLRGLLCPADPPRSRGPPLPCGSLPAQRAETLLPGGSSPTYGDHPPPHVSPPSRLRGLLRLADPPFPRGSPLTRGSPTPRIPPLTPPIPHCPADPPLPRGFPLLPHRSPLAPQS
ncbi:proline-rich protein HaeIII subfamily 1-like [Cuculus canorus]|uniref:proline-rich protein HaeIII subfamily 1-like n=1 Tax=Cuculus canorus TaxID=55661 RepID=UPI0023AAF07C|nr:proline-rich protein HaeIII subfamily 1-like [Cuculus canorus]